MDKLKYYLLKYPNQIKYGLIIANTFLIFVAIKIFINYNNIEQAISQTAEESRRKTDEYGFTQNFQLAYERSEYAQHFLKHENNILLPGETIIKFEDKAKLVSSGEGSEDNFKNGIKIIKTPEESRQQFFKERFFPAKEVK